MRKDIGERIKAFRKRLGLSQVELADKIGVTNRAVSNWESGANGVDVDLLENICTVLKISPNDLLHTPDSNQLSNDALDVARDFDSLTPVGQELVRGTLNFAVKHHSRHAASSQNGIPLKQVGTISIGSKPVPVYDAANDSEIFMRYTSNQEVRELQDEETHATDPHEQ